jgi:polar amino acid transport system substrate-binding protein
MWNMTNHWGTTMRAGIRKLKYQSGLISRGRRALLCTMGALCVSASFMGTALASDLPDVEARGTLRVAVPQDYLPFGAMGADLKLHGYDIDTAQYLADKMHLKLQLIPVTSANRVPYLVTNRVDLIISSLGMTPERAQTIDFSNPYAPFFFGVYSAKNEAPIKSPAELAGKEIGAARGALEEIMVSQVAPKSATVQRYEDNATTVSAFESGQVDYIAMGNPIVAALVKRGGPRIPHLILTLKESPCRIGMAKGANALRQKVNDIWAGGMKDGTFDRLSVEWFGTKLPPGFGQ